MKMVKHQVEIIETLRKVVEIELPENSNKDARQIAMDRYHDGDIILSGDNYYDTEFNYLGVKEK